MDIAPENINPGIVAIAKKNRLIKEIFTVYLHELPIKDGFPLTWQDALEMMVLKLADQYGGALKGWKDTVDRAAKPPAPDKLLLTDTLVNEKSVSAEVQSPEKVQLEIAKGMLATLISPARRAHLAAGGQDVDFPPIMLKRSFIQQVDALLDGKVDLYIQPDPCPNCDNHAWYIMDGKRVCAVCQARKGKRALELQKKKMTEAFTYIMGANPDISIPKEATLRFDQIAKLKVNEE